MTVKKKKAATKKKATKKKAIKGTWKHFSSERQSYPSVLASQKSPKKKPSKQSGDDPD
jgi:hypothetical protein